MIVTLGPLLRELKLGVRTELLDMDRDVLERKEEPPDRPPEGRAEESCGTPNIKNAELNKTGRIFPKLGV